MNIIFFNAETFELICMKYILKIAVQVNIHKDHSSTDCYIKKLELPQLKSKKLNHFLKVKITDANDCNVIDFVQSQLALFTLARLQNLNNGEFSSYGMRSGGKSKSFT